MIKWENSIIVIAAPSPLLLDNGPCIVSRCRKQRYALIVAIFVSRIFTVTDEEHARARFQVGPTHLADFLLAHRGCNGETYYLANRCYLTSVRIEVTDEPVEFILRRPPVALLAFPNEAKPLQGDTRQINRLDLDR